MGDGPRDWQMTFSLWLLRTLGVAMMLLFAGLFWTPLLIAGAAVGTAAVAALWIGVFVLMGSRDD